MYTESIGFHTRSYTTSRQYPDLSAHRARNSGPFARGTAENFPGPATTPPSAPSQMCPRGTVLPVPTVRVDAAGWAGRRLPPVILVPSIKDHRKFVLLVGFGDQPGPQSGRVVSVHRVQQGTGREDLPEVTAAARMPAGAVAAPDPPPRVHDPQPAGQCSFKTGTTMRAFTRVHASRITQVTLGEQA